jgi:cystathionine gamma-synthase/methionine-gamma-lyase
MPEKPPRDFATEVVHAGERRAAPHGQPVSTPIYTSATYTYSSMAEMDRVFAGDDAGFVYSRYGNPTNAALCDVMQQIEAGAACVVYGSGMAALHAALLACEAGQGTTILASQDLYGATLGLLLQVMSQFGVEAVVTDFADVDAVRRRATELKPRVMLAETISNPLLKVCDVAAIAEIAHGVGARLIVDNTFASPFLCQPLLLGADVVVHSATKYLGGHNDAMGGIVVVRDAALATPLTQIMRLVGGVLSAWEAHEIARGIRTLALRMERQCENACDIAQKLAREPRIARVHYPALREGAAQDVLRRTLRPPHAGALVSVELAENTREAAFRFQDALRLCVRSTSLGDVFTSVLHPMMASHRDVPPARRRALGIADGLVRISMGIESADDILADIRQALATI